MPSDDATYVSQCLQGNQNAFGELVRRYEHAAYGLALSCTRDFTAAEDMAQEAFISAYRNLPDLREPSKFGPWLKQMVVNMCRNHQRKRSTEKNALENVETDVQLQEYSIPEKTDDYFPLQPNARWCYTITNNRVSYTVRDTNWIAAQDDKASYIANFHYAE